MGLHVVYVASAPPYAVDGGHLASTKGWDDFCTFVDARERDYPESAYLTDGPVDEAVPGSLARLAAELPQVQAEAGSDFPDVASVAGVLAQALAAMPVGCIGVYVSDGEPGEEEPWESNVQG